MADTDALISALLAGQRSPVPLPPRRPPELTPNPPYFGTPEWGVLPSVDNPGNPVTGRWDLNDRLNDVPDPRMGSENMFFGANGFSPTEMNMNKRIMAKLGTGI